MTYLFLDYMYVCMWIGNQDIIREISSVTQYSTTRANVALVQVERRTFVKVCVLCCVPTQFPGGASFETPLQVGATILVLAVFLDLERLWRQDVQNVWKMRIVCFLLSIATTRSFDIFYSSRGVASSFARRALSYRFKTASRFDGMPSI